MTTIAQKEILNKLNVLDRKITTIGFMFTAVYGTKDDVGDLIKRFSDFITDMNQEISRKSEQ